MNYKTCLFLQAISQKAAKQMLRECREGLIPRSLLCCRFDTLSACCGVVAFFDNTRQKTCCRPLYQCLFNAHSKNILCC